MGLARACLEASAEEDGEVGLPRLDYVVGLQREPHEVAAWNTWGGGRPDHMRLRRASLVGGLHACCLASSSTVSFTRSPK